MDAGFTSGPWAIAPFDTDSFSMVSANFLREAGDESLNGGVYVAKVQGPDNRANARLIAAAPDMFEALEGSTVALEEAANILREKLPSLAENVLMPVVRKNRVALAKARGDTQSISGEL